MPSFPSVPKNDLNFHLTQVIRLILVRFISQSSSEEVWLLISAPQCLHTGKKTKPLGMTAEASVKVHTKEEGMRGASGNLGCQIPYL